MTTAELVAAICEAPAQDVPALAMAVAARLAQVGTSMAMAVPSTSGNGQAVEDVNLSAREAARRLGVSRPYLYKHADEYPFARRIGKRVVFDRRGLEAWNLGQRPRLTAGSLEG